MSDGRALSVRLDGELVGELRVKPNGNLQFRYAEGYPGPPLSWSMPIREEAYPHAACAAWFGGLLPEGDVRDVLSRQFGVSSQNQFALLTELGGDCAGAVTLSLDPEDSASLRIEPIPLSDAELEKLIESLPRHPLGVDTARGVRMSLAGAQPKIPVIVDMFDMYLPRSSSTPTTHIVKPSLGVYPGIVQNESFCMALAGTVWPRVPDVSARRLPGGHEYLLVKRFDRVERDGRQHRVHQEDFCQALSIPAERKYQQEGGPSLADSAELIRGASSNPVIDLQALWDVTVFNWAIGNCDAHGKNFSLLYESRSPRLAPFYDLVSTLVYPELDTRMAMSIGDARQLDEVNASAFAQLARLMKIGERNALARATSLIELIKGSARLLMTIDEYRNPVAAQINARLQSLDLNAN